MQADDSSDQPQDGTAEARPALRDPERTSAAILEAATREFAEKGFGGARVDSIAARAGTNKRMLYHYFGERIYEVGILGAPDLIEEPHGELDLVLIREFGDHWKLNIKAQNLLDERKEITQGGFVATGYNEGRKASLKLEYRF